MPSRLTKYMVASITEFHLKASNEMPRPALKVVDAETGAQS